ncbi:helix-turn-helix domain-containing protein [Belnapia rosea]|uniref:Transcriptional regulator, contains XRE-family HTH domain n=1 Tax=Belnapia rosea TaxID=938405 RepID=A0A1G6WTW5_9PROT|nr:helix-turn-helix transcriptional regulator [Belnapia rosea]SDB68340.1 Transcriptional regulator, contains XRE-family HTH domain [Belnapia rosea]SDD68526.1 Transcriptional regulator, contains XRE-family HTH domain [Belnapia rosea]
MRFADIGQQLRAYRLESGLRAEEIAARLGVSRAALYRYEKGEVIKLDTIRRLAELLKISPLSLLGIGVEYFSRPVAFQERLRQVEEQADQILLVGGALCYQVSTDAFEGALAEAWTEAAEASAERAPARAMADQALGLLTARKKVHQQRRPNIIGILSEASLRRFLQEGVAAGIAVPERTRARCRAAAVTEAESIAAMMESVPIGLQLGLSTGPDPSGAFIVLRGRDRAHVVGSPFPPDAPPTSGLGVAMITAADEAISVHQRVAEAAWRDALKGAAAAARIRELVAAARPA